MSSNAITVTVDYPDGSDDFEISIEKFGEKTVVVRLSDSCEEINALLDGIDAVWNAAENGDG